MRGDAFVVPLKRFDLAKERLRQGGTASVTALAEELAIGVVRGCAPRQVIVLSEDVSVSAFALANGAEVFESSASSLNQAVQLAYEALGRRFDRLIVVHGDLSDPVGLGHFEPGAGITIVTDHHGRGTNVLALPTGLDFHFAYGADSASLHRAEAERLGVECRTITDSPWRYDVDEPGDLGPPESI